MLSMGLGMIDPDNPLTALNNKLHQSDIYNGFQMGVSMLSSFSGAASQNMAFFIAGTMVLTATGLVAIEKLSAGDVVISTNPDTLETAGKTVLETYVRRAFFSVNEDEKRKGRDIMWYIWAAPNSPLFGKDKMTTFERYFIKDKETHKETKNAYYHLLENENVVDDLLREFELDPEKGHIINGHVPVHQSEGESPVKCNGKVLVIDGGFSRPYQKVTGIAGYTLVYNSYGLILSAHEPFTSAEEAVAKEQDIVSNRVAVHYNNKRTLVGDTDTGTALKERISELIQLLEVYRKGIIKEKK